jgi:DNA-binding CsgD family transcriptional regulator
MLLYLPDALARLDRLHQEYPNLRAAMDWRRSTGDAAGVVRIAAGLFPFWHIGGQLADGRKWLEWTMSQPGLNAADATDGTLTLAGIAYAQDEYPYALTLSQEATAGHEASGDAFGAAFAWHLTALIAMGSGEPKLAATAIEEASTRFAALPDVPGQPGILASLAMYRGWVTFLRGQWEEAAAFFGELLRRQQAADLENQWTRLNLAHVMRALGDPTAALEHYQAALHCRWRHQAHRVYPRALMGAAGLLAARGEWPRAARWYGATEAFCMRTGQDFQAMWDFERALGLPEPWLRADTPMRKEAEIVRALVLARGGRSLPPLPDPQRAAAEWARGQTLPFAEATAEALVPEPALLLPSSREAAEAPAPAPTVTGICLTRREREILRYLCQRMTDGEIAEMLFLSPRTVEYHVRNLLDKLGAENRRAAAAIAARLALV